MIDYFYRWPSTGGSSTKQDWERYYTMDQKNAFERFKSQRAAERARREENEAYERDGLK